MNRTRCKKMMTMHWSRILYVLYKNVFLNSRLRIAYMDFGCPLVNRMCWVVCCYRQGLLFLPS